jgi:hypothetical protein
MFNLKNFTNGQRLFTYKVAHDGGSAPNPFHKLCTLAICKPKIRSIAKNGDVIVGLACGNDGRIVYCMVVDESLPWAEYIEKCKQNHIKGKIPKNENHQGDCIWTNSANFSEAFDSWSGHRGEEDFDRDVKNGKNVLTGKSYWYFGKGDIHKINLPDDLKTIIPGRGHRSNANNDYREDFVKFFNETLDKEKITKIGNLGTPELDPEKTDKQICSRCRAEERESDEHGEES